MSSLTSFTFINKKYIENVERRLFMENVKKNWLYHKKKQKFFFVKIVMFYFVVVAS